jgi:cyclohexyl-isocyanide hydratase
VAELQGEAQAQAIQLGLEYAPAPPFRSGTPEEAPPAVLDAVRQRLGPMTQARRAIIDKLTASSSSAAS